MYIKINRNDSNDGWSIERIAVKREIGELAGSKISKWMGKPIGYSSQHGQDLFYTHLLDEKAPLAKSYTLSDVCIYIYIFETFHSKDEKHPWITFTKYAGILHIR